MLEEHLECKAAGSHPSKWRREARHTAGSPQGHGIDFLDTALYRMNFTAVNDWGTTRCSWQLQGDVQAFALPCKPYSEIRFDDPIGDRSIDVRGNTLE